MGKYSNRVDELLRRFFIKKNVSSIIRITRSLLFKKDIIYNDKINTRMTHDEVGAVIKNEIDLKSILNNQ